MHLVSSSSTRLAEAAAPVTITSILRKPEVFPTLTASVLARLPFGAMGLLVILRLTDAGYSYGQAGLVAAAYAFAVAFGQPVLSRVIDRDGQTRVLLISAATGAAATAALAFVPATTPLAGFVVLAALNGALQPPLGGTMRALWDILLTSDEDRHVGYAVEASAVEVIFTGGPLVLVGVIAAAFGPQAGLLACAALTGGGTVAFALSRASRRWTPTERLESHVFGPLRTSGVRTLMVVSAAAGTNFGAIEITVTAVGRENGNITLVGIMLAIWSIGSLIGGLVIARMRPAEDPARRIVLLLVAMATGSALVGVANSPWAIAPLLLLAGVSIAPIFATAHGLMGVVCPPGTITEAFAWTASAVMVGLTLGSPGAGFLIDHVSTNAAFVASGLPLLVAAAVVWGFRRTLHVHPDYERDVVAAPGSATP